MTQAAPAKKIGFSPKPQVGEVVAKPPPRLRPALVEPREEITNGSVLLKSGTMLPANLPMESRRVGDWDLIRKPDGFGVDRKLRLAGWQFFFIVPAVEASAIGIDPQKTFDKALGRITRAVEAQRLNALEITD